MKRTFVFFALLIVFASCSNGDGHPKDEPKSKQLIKSDTIAVDTVIMK